MTSGLRLNNITFSYFSEWSPNMAYILGFTCADGSIFRRTLSWELSNKYASDKVLLEKFSREMGTSYNVEERQNSFRLRIHSIFLVNELKRFGIVQNKTKKLLFPNIPKEFVRHFIRGFFDGDGWISMRNKKISNEINVGFVSGSEDFLIGLAKSIKDNTSIEKITRRKRIKVSKKGVESIYYSIDFYGQNANTIIHFLYDGLSDFDLFLERKYERQILARKLFKKSQRILKFGKKWVRMEEEKKTNIYNTLIRLYQQENLLPREIAVRLGVSLATIYRWMERINLRIPSKRGTPEWKSRIFRHDRTITKAC